MDIPFQLKHTLKGYLKSYGAQCNLLPPGSTERTFMAGWCSALEWVSAGCPVPRADHDLPASPAPPPGEAQIVAGSPGHPVPDERAVRPAVPQDDPSPPPRLAGPPHDH